jgi:hypothetical protein
MYIFGKIEIGWRRKLPRPPIHRQEDIKHEGKMAPSEGSVPLKLKR